MHRPEPSPTGPFDGCVACGAGRGEPHRPDCHSRYRPGYERGMAQAIRICRERGWAVAHVTGEGWRPCAPADPDAYLDLDRYAHWQEHGCDLLDGNEP